jgi:adenosine deaminase
MSDILSRLPKAEVHLHLEGTISSDTLWAMAHANHVALPTATPDALRTMYEFKDFDSFVKLWLLMCSCLRTPDDYARMVDGFLGECHRQNIRYAELHFTPYNHEKFGIGGATALTIVTKRIEQAQEHGGPVVRLITDISGESADLAGPYTLTLLEQEANPLVVALGLGGPEVGIPRSRFAPYFERARRAGYATVAHAGETGGPEHVRQAVLELGARRVQHGVRAADDPAVLALLAERRICCDIALTSNEQLKVYPEFRTHPLRKFLTDLLREWRRAQEELGLSAEEVWELNLNGLRYGLAETAVRRRLLLEFERAAAGVFPAGLDAAELRPADGSGKQGCTD